jgi:uncharacterized alkaline shock family protein YloU
MSEKEKNCGGRGNVRVSDCVVQQSFKEKMKRAGRYVKLDFNDKTVAIDIANVGKYGYVIAEVGEAVQDSVKAAVEDMTGLTVTCVNVTCSGIAFPKEKKN